MGDCSPAWHGTVVLLQTIVHEVENGFEHFVLGHTTPFNVACPVLCAYAVHTFSLFGLFLPCNRGARNHDEVAHCIDYAHIWCLAQWGREDLPSAIV